MPRYSQPTLEELLRLAARSGGAGLTRSGGRGGGGSGYGGGFIPSDTTLPYNVTAGNSSRIKAKLLAVQAGTDDARVIDIGDSLTAGSVSASFPLGERATARPHYEAVALASLLGVVVEERTLCGSAGKTTTAAYETMVPEYNFNSGTISANATLGGRQFQHALASGADVYTPGGTFEKVRLWYAGPTTTRSIVVTTDTAATATYNGDSNFAPRNSVLDCPGAATVSFRAGTAAAVNWHIIECYNDSVKRVALWNGGWNGADSIDWAALTPASGPIGMLDFADPDFVLFGVGPNDVNDTTPIADFKTNLQVVIDTVLGNGGNIGLLGQPPMDPSFYTSQSKIDSYETAIREVALANNIIHLPYRHLLGANWTESVANGYSYGGSDPVHLTPLGCQYVAENAVIPMYQAILAA